MKCTGTRKGLLRVAFGRRFMLCRFGFLLVLGLLFSCPVSFADEPALSDREMVCPRAEVALRDGRVPAGAWEQAAPFELVLTATGGRPEPPTSGRIMHDDENLYVKVVCLAPERLDIPRQLARNDRRITSEHDNLQLFLTPGPSPDSYYRLAIDRRGNVWDTAYRRDGGAVEGDGWNPEWGLHVSEIPGGWQAEFVIPFAIFGAETPRRGDVWRFKLGRYGQGLPYAMWPLNPHGRFHPPETDGALYFETENLLQGGDFADAPLGATVPPGWSVTRVPEELGEVEVVADENAVGGKALRYLKRTTEDHRPQVWSRGHRLPHGAAYELSARLKGGISNMNVRMDTNIEGTRYRRGEGKRPAPHYRRFAFRFVVPDGAGPVNVGFSPGTPVAGEAFLDDVVLRRLLDDAMDRQEAAFVPPKFELPPDPVHGLDSFMERAGVKPWELFQCAESGGVKTWRVIFLDKEHGTEIWMMDNSHTPESDPGASVWSCWNADASTLYLGGGRYFDGRMLRGWLFNADFSRLLPTPFRGRPNWDREDPLLCYSPSNPRGSVTRHDLRTGESRVLAEWRAHPRERLYGLTRDNRYVFVDVVNGGIWVPYEPDENLPIPRMRLHDGRPAAPDGSVLMGGVASTTYADPWGHLYRIRVGKFICKETGEARRAILPVCGETNYLKTFKSGRVRFPRGEEWEGYAMEPSWDDVPIPTDASVDELYEMFRYPPWMTHGHQSPSSDGVFYALDGGATTIWRIREGKLETTVRASTSGSNYHLHWKNHPNFLVAWVRGWLGMTHGTFARPDNASLIYLAFADGTWQPVLDTKHRFTPARRCSYEMLSPDATKIHYASTMTGRSKNYVAVLARPRPPVGVAWEERGGDVLIRWQPPASAREIKGYLVYRSERSGAGYALMTPDPVEGLEWLDESVRPGQAHFYVVTSLEHSNVESGYSAEASFAGVGLEEEGAGGAVRIYLEPEAAIFDLPYSQVQPGLSLGRDRLGASNWFYVYRTPTADEGAASLRADVPVDGSYFVWARVRSSEGREGWWRFSLGGVRAEAKTAEEDWTWVLASPSPVALRRGALEVAFSTHDIAAQLDLICLTTDATHLPDGPRPEESPVPEAPSGLRVAEAEGRTIHLAWEHEKDAHFSHYNVYGARQPIGQARQAFLLGSPTDTEFIDWGLRAGTRYHYAVTAVNRRGDESAPARVSVATPPRVTALFEAQLAFDQAERTGPFEEGDADGLRAGKFLVPLNPEENAASWRIEVPEKTVAHLWLRYLPGLEQRVARRVAVYQNIKVSLNGRRLATLDLPTALNIPDSYLTKEGNPLAPHFWTWGAPVVHQLEGVTLPAGEHTITLSNLAGEVRYDVLFITNEPSFQPEDGRLRQ